MTSSGRDRGRVRTLRQLELGAIENRFPRTWGSANALQTLLKNDLIDEYRLFAFPVVFGSGKRLFGSGTVPLALKQVESVPSVKGGTYRRFERGGKRSTGRWGLRSN